MTPRPPTHRVLFLLYLDEKVLSGKAMWFSLYVLLNINHRTITRKSHCLRVASFDFDSFFWPDGADQDIIQILI